MRWQTVMALALVGSLAASAATADTIDFSTDPNLATEWTQYPFYSSLKVGPLTAAWNSVDQNLDLTANNTEALDGLYKTGATRSEMDGVTVTLSDYTANTPLDGPNWTCAGLVVSASANPDLFSGSASYALYFQQDYNGGIRYAVNKNGLTELHRETLGSIPSTMKLDILRDGADYVFKANGVELFRDNSNSGTALPNYFIYWGGGAGDTLSLSADNFGVVPEPTSIAMLIAAGLGLVCYAWRKRR